MKIGIDIRTLMDAEYSGVPEYTLNLIKEILRLDSDNEYKLFYNSFADLEHRISNFEGNNLEIIKTSYPNKIFNYLFQKIFKWPKIDKLLDVDIFFMPHINFVSISSNAKKIITIHDLSFLRYPDFFSLRKNIWHKLVNIKKLLKSFDIVVAVSENTKKDLIELCDVPAEKIKVIYSGIDNDYKKIEDREKLEETKKKYSLPDKFILFLATLEPRKNIDGLIKSFDRFQNKYPQFNDYELIIAGGKGWKGKKLFEAWQTAKHKDKIKFLGYVDREDKKYLYNLASLFVYPSFYEGFGFPPLEAMASGVPVITSNSSSLPEIVRDKAVLVNPYDISEISGAIFQMLSRKDLQKQISERSLGHAKNFSWEKSAREYIGLFSS